MKAKQLFCFTYAGGNASFFDVIEKDLPGIDLIKLEYAGHGNRHREPFYESFDELADDMFAQFCDRRNEADYALFGYSMGTISLSEILKRILADKSMIAPSHVFLAAHEPHSKAELAGFTPEELDEWVKARTIRFGGVPEKLKDNKSFWRMYTPLFRADYSIIGKYKFENLELRTDIPTTVFYSEEDTPFVEMKQWENYFVGDCDF